MQPLTFIISIFFLHVTQLQALPPETADSDVSRRLLEFNVKIKNYPGTTTTEQSLLDYISGSVSDTISSIYDKVKNVVTGPEEKEEEVKRVYPAKLRRYQRRYPIPYPFPPPVLVDQRLPIRILNTPINGYVPNYDWNRQISNAGIADKGGEKKNPTEVQYFVNKYGHLIAKEVPIESDKNEKQSGEKPIGNYFNIDLHGRMQNASDTPVLYGGATLNSGRQQLKRDLKNLVSDIIAVQNTQEKS